MTNGKFGDHPLSDLVVYRAPQFSPAVDALILEIYTLRGLPYLYALPIDWFKPPPMSDLEAELRRVRNQLTPGERR
jgi:hypothetical protein